MTFRIGINMAGAISAGAYTAGALDFLIQALDEWWAVEEVNVVRQRFQSLRRNTIDGLLDLATQVNGAHGHV